MRIILKSCKNFSRFFVLLTIATFNIIYAQESIHCKVDGKNFEGKIENAVLINMGNENFIQIKAVDNDRIMYVYFKTARLNDATPVIINYKNTDTDKDQTPDAEIVWAPEGPDRPQWNSVDGKIIINQYDSEEKTISGTFEFIVEKFQYGSKAKDNRPSINIQDGKFGGIRYKVEENN